MIETDNTNYILLPNDREYTVEDFARLGRPVARIFQLREEIIDYAASVPGPPEKKIVILQSSLPDGSGAPSWLVLEDEIDKFDAQFGEQLPEVVRELRAFRDYPIEKKKGTICVLYQDMESTPPGRLYRIRLGIGAGAA